MTAPYRLHGSVCSPRLGWTMLAAYALALAYAGGLWLHLLHDAEGATELDAPPPAIHWLRDSTLALPLVTLAVWMGSRLAERLVARYGAGTSRALVAAVLPVTLAFYASVAVGAGNPVHGVLFTAQHDGHDLPPVVLRATCSSPCSSREPRPADDTSSFARDGWLAPVCRC